IGQVKFRQHLSLRPPPATAPKPMSQHEAARPGHVGAIENRVTVASQEIEHAPVAVEFNIGVVDASLGEQAPSAHQGCILTALDIHFEKAYRLIDLVIETDERYLVHFLRPSQWPPF